MADSIDRVGGTAALLVALAYIGTGVSALWMPPELQGRPEVTPHEFWLALARDPTAHLAFHWCWVASGLVGLAAVPAIARLGRPASEGWSHWGAALGYLGFAVNARSHLMEIAFDRKIIPLYLDSPEAFQQAVHVVAGLALDVPEGWLTYGGLGAWVAIASVCGRRAGALSRGQLALGLVAAMSCVLGVLGYTLTNRPLLVLSIGVGGLLVVPGWFAWIGIGLRRGRLSAERVRRRL